MVSIVELKQPIVVIVDPSQPIQHVVELVHVENPQFFITQLVPVFGHSTYNLRQISMFLEQVT
jgi:hypothetical protein